jgi:hypothetical protein
MPPDEADENGKMLLEVVTATGGVSSSSSSS